MITKDYLNSSTDSQAYMSAGFIREGVALSAFLRGKESSPNTISTQERRQRLNEQKSVSPSTYKSLCSAKGVTISALIRGKEENAIEHARLTAKGDGSIGLISCHFFHKSDLKPI